MLALLFSVSSCQEELKNLDPNPDSQDFARNGRVEKPTDPDPDDDDDSESMVLGKQLNDPYSMVNMTNAYYAVLATLPKGEKPPRPPKQTHIYVKFMPQNDEQLEILENTREFEVYDYPVDFEIVKDGHYYRDSAVPSDRPTYQYATVSVYSRNFPPKGIPYEKLEEISIPEEEKVYEVRMGKFSQTFAEILVQKSLELTGNLDPIEEAGLKNDTQTNARHWRPAGNIKVRDIYDEPHNTTTNTNLFPVEGVKVRARKWHRSKSAFTNANGDFSFAGTFKGKVNYSLKWGRGNFSVHRRSFSVGTARYNGSRKKGNWNLVITNPKQHQYAHVFRGAHYYYYAKDILGLQRPFSPKYGVGSVIIAKNKFVPSNAGSYDPYTNRFIKVRTFKQSSEFIYANIMHELTHSAHDNMEAGYNKVDEKVKESWAMGASYALTRLVYPKHKGHPYNLIQSPNYTNVVVDLMDNLSDDAQNFGFLTLSDNSGPDRVDSYAIKQIQNALRDQKTWNEWRDNIKNKYNNATENEVDRLFAAWD